MKVWSLSIATDDQLLFHCHVVKTARHYAVIGGALLVLAPLLYSGVYRTARSRRVPFSDFFTSVCPHTEPCGVHHVHEEESHAPSVAASAASGADGAERLTHPNPIVAAVLQRVGASVERMQYAPTSAFARDVARTATATFLWFSSAALLRSFVVDLVSHAGAFAVCLLLDRCPRWRRQTTTVRGFPRCGVC
ncbi:hypothetical protein STCU_10141 [Strigomonas culicis]|uniref:Uncharacterized protein n=1 Tax=Strigomonas culicis TaxID=28005 RepID=S9TP37_9TRYP|nr:hypothetical protein STCU_10141 [Strigomonas culicis]|eukprot:EPY18168.1 hypothetical protein STCU_10141 [Strigomonas culicis]